MQSTQIQAAEKQVTLSSFSFKGFIHYKHVS